MENHLFAWKSIEEMFNSLVESSRNRNISIPWRQFLECIIFLLTWEIESKSALKFIVNCVKNSSSTHWFRSMKIKWIISWGREERRSCQYYVIILRFIQIMIYFILLSLVTVLTINETVRGFFNYLIIFLLPFWRIDGEIWQRSFTIDSDRLHWIRCDMQSSRSHYLYLIYECLRDRMVVNFRLSKNGHFQSRDLINSERFHSIASRYMLSLFTHILIIYLDKYTRYEWEISVNMNTIFTDMKHEVD